MQAHSTHISVTCDRNRSQGTVPIFPARQRRVRSSDDAAKMGLSPSHAPVPGPRTLSRSDPLKANCHDTGFRPVAASPVGVEAGWEPLADGGHEYTIQIEPSLVGRLQNGNDLVSEVPPTHSMSGGFALRLAPERCRIDGPPAAIRPKHRRHQRRRPGTLRPTMRRPPPGRQRKRSTKPSSLRRSKRHRPMNLWQCPRSIRRRPTSPSAIQRPTRANRRRVQRRHSQPEPSVAPPSRRCRRSSNSRPTRHNRWQATIPPQPARSSPTTPRSLAWTRPPAIQSPPWVPFLVAAVLLACSLGANVYLGWVAWEARHRLCAVWPASAPRRRRDQTCSSRCTGWQLLELQRAKRRQPHPHRHECGDHAHRAGASRARDQPAAHPERVDAGLHRGHVKVRGQRG